MPAFPLDGDLPDSLTTGTEYGSALPAVFSTTGELLSGANLHGTDSSGTASNRLAGFFVLFAVTLTD
jgi:hypothetical protein